MAVFDVYRVELFGEQLRWIGPEGDLIDQRPLQGVEGLVVEVGRSLGAPAVIRDLRAVGGSLYRWLDGERGWLTGARARNRGFTLKIDAGKRLGYLPWELCCDDEQFLVEVVGQPFNPYRRVLARRPDERTYENRPLRILFTACSPENEPVLNFEEEEAKILKATQGFQIELVVEESGSLAGILERLREYGADYFDILHLSGHAGVLSQQPVFVMEDFQGDSAYVKSEQVADAFAFNWPRLIFLSGCETGQAPGDGYLPSFCESLVRAGAPLVLGWSHPVGDRAASEAAAVLYGQLASGARLDQAICMARQSLFKENAPDWYLLRCYGDDSPHLAFVTPPRTKGRVHLNPRPVRDHFLDAGAQIKVCPPEAFIGRRRLLQRCLRRLLASPAQIEDYYEGLILTGMGGLGKSSLAERLCSRLCNYKPLIWVGHCDELSLLDRLERELDMRDIKQFLYQPDTSLLKRLKTLFAQLEQPLVLVFDDFEQNGEQDATGQPRFDEKGRLLLRSEAQEPLRGVLEAIRETATPHRVIITCRYEISPLSAKARLFVAGLDHFSGADLTKKLQRLPGFKVKELGELAMRAQQLADGNSRLLETFDALLCQQSVTIHQFDKLFNQLESTATLFREQVLLRGLLDLLDDDCRLLLAKMNLCHLPIPKKVIDDLADEETLTNGLNRAISLGLVERFESSEDNCTLYVSNILEPLLEDLLDNEQRRASQGQLAELLFNQWANGSFNWDRAQELHRLAIAAVLTPVIHNISAIIANRLFVTSQYHEASVFCQNALNLGRDPRVLTELSQIEYQLGYTAAARTHLEEAIALCESAPHDDSNSNSLSRALGYLARHLYQQGEKDNAMIVWKKALAIKENLGDLQGKANTLTTMSGVFIELGMVKHALDLSSEALILSTQIGDKRGVAVAQNAMAKCYAACGDSERAFDAWNQATVIIEKIGDDQAKSAFLANMAIGAGQFGKNKLKRTLNLRALRGFAAIHAWINVLEILRNLSNSNDSQALMQAMWVMIRTQPPLEDSLNILLQHRTLDPRLLPLITATVRYLVYTRNQNHPKLEQFREDARAILLSLLPEDKRSQDGQDGWLAQPEHSDPGVFLPCLSKVLEELIGEGWYFDHTPLLLRPFAY